MIRSFGDKATADVFHDRPTGRARRLPPDIVRRAVEQLDMVNAALRLEDLRSPPGNRLEALSGELVGFYSIRVNRQWRIIFRWVDGDPTDVRLIDYHRG